MAERNGGRRARSGYSHSKIQDIGFCLALGGAAAMTNFAIDTDQMFATAARLATHHAKSDEHFRERHTQLLRAVEAGWVGRSANVMSGALGRWQSDANAMLARIAGHSAGVASATLQFVDVDKTAAGSLAPGAPSTLDL